MARPSASFRILSLAASQRSGEHSARERAPRLCARASAACTAPGGIRRNNRSRKSLRFRRAAVIVAAKAALIRGDAPLAELPTAGSGQARHKRGQHKQGKRGGASL
jgi:hypothetical protein